MGKHGMKRKAEIQAMKEVDHDKGKKKQKEKQVTAITVTSQPNPPRCSFISQPFFPHCTASTSTRIGSVGLIPILSRIEKKIDWLTFLMTGTPSHDDPPQQVSPQNDLEQQTCSTLMNMHTMDTKKATFDQTESGSYTNLAARQQKEEDQTAPTNQSIDATDNFVNTTDNIVLLHNRSKSCSNFAVLLVRDMFERSELIGHNVCGVRGKLKMDPVRMNRIKDLVNEFYPSPLEERDSVWRNCRKAIDSFLRKLK